MTGSFTTIVNEDVSAIVVNVDVNCATPESRCMRSIDVWGQQTEGRDVLHTHPRKEKTQTLNLDVMTLNHGEKKL